MKPFSHFREMLFMHMNLLGFEVRYDVIVWSVYSLNVIVVVVV